MNILLGENMIGWYHKETPQGMVKLIKLVQYNSWAISFLTFYNCRFIFLMFIHCMPKVYGLKFSMELKKVGIVINL
jgi:hypothetical protein